jgi:peroxiredoxin
VSFPFLLDEDRTVTKAYGLYHRLGIDAFNIAHPASMVVDRDRTIRYIYRGDSQSDRAPLDQVLAVVRKLKP